MRRLIFVAAVATCLAACGSPSPEETAISRHEAIVAAPAATGSPQEANWHRFADNVKVWSPGYKVTLRPGADAGTPEQRLAALRAGTVQIAALGPQAAAALVPELAVLSAPGLFASEQQADFILDKVVFEQFHGLFLQKGLELLGWIDDGWVDPSTRERYQAGVIVADKAWFERLPPQDRDVFRQAYASAGQARATSRAARHGPGAAAPAPQVADAATLQQRAVASAGSAAQAIYHAILEGKAEFAARQELQAPAKGN